MKCGNCGADVDNGVCAGCGRRYYGKGDVLVIHRGSSTQYYFADSLKKSQLEELSRGMGRFVSLSFYDEGPSAKNVDDSVIRGQETSVLQSQNIPAFVLEPQSFASDSSVRSRVVNNSSKNHIAKVLFWTVLEAFGHLYR